MEQEEQLGLLEQLVRLEVSVKLVEQASQDPLEELEWLELRDQQADQERLALLAQLEPQATLAHLVPRDPLGKQEALEQQDPWEQQASRVQTE